MRKETKSKVVQTITSDRSLMLQLGVLLVIAILCSIWIGLLIKPSDVTVYARYTAFGQAHFYKEHWQYFYLFIMFIWTVAGLHGGLMVKFSLLERPKTRLAVLWCAVVLLLIGLVYMLSVMSLGQSA